MKKREDALYRETDRLFGWLLLGQWVLAIAIACATTPLVWPVHFHVVVAVIFGGAVNAVPLILIRVRPGWWGTRHAIAVAQMAWGAMLIMITGGRIETHFHVFVSLAFLALYRDWKPLITASGVVVIDHLVRGLAWPDSVYGIANPAWWRFLEHAAWVAFEDVVLVVACVRATALMQREAMNEAALIEARTDVERQVEARTHELHESLDRYRDLLENTEAMPFECDPIAGTAPYIAPQLARLLGCELHDLNDVSFLRSRIHPDDLQRVLAVIIGYVREGSAPTAPLEYRLQARDGRLVHIRAFLSQRSADGTRVRGVMLDVSRWKVLESELRQAHKLESLGRLAAGVAHEINTPIQFVSDSVQFARDAIGDLITVTAKIPRESQTVDLPYIVDELPKALDRALDGAARVAAIVKSMSALARGQEQQRLQIDVGGAIAQVLAQARYDAVADLVLDLRPVPPIAGFPAEFRQVLLQLVDNAADAIARTGCRGKIAIATRADGDAVVISIGDTGGGIPLAIREQIFDPFYTTKDVGAGTGQGLAVARASIVERHAGTLTFETTEGVGTTFHIRIPAAAILELAA